MLGYLIKIYLDNQGFKHCNIAKKMDLSPTAFSDILANRRKMSVIEYFKLCEVLNIPVDYFKNELDKSA